MPTYVYEGLNSGTRFEVEQRITEAPLTNNPETGESVKRIIFASAVVFKGSGFYKNDSRAPESASKSDSGKSDSGKSDANKSSSESSTTASTKESGSSDSSSGKSDVKPAPSAPAATSKAASAD